MGPFCLNISFNDRAFLIGELFRLYLMGASNFDGSITGAFLLLSGGQRSTLLRIWIVAYTIHDYCHCHVRNCTRNGVYCFCFRQLHYQVVKTYVCIKNLKISVPTLTLNSAIFNGHVNVALRGSYHHRFYYSIERTVLIKNNSLRHICIKLTKIIPNSFCIKFHLVKKFISGNSYKYRIFNRID